MPLSDVEQQVWDEDLRQSELFPGQYVAYADIWHAQEDGRKKLERVLLAHSENFTEFQEKLQAHPRWKELAPTDMRSAYIELPGVSMPSLLEIGVPDGTVATDGAAR